MSLLLCFFVMMLNFGSLHSDELANLFGVLSGANEIMPVKSTGQLVPRNQSKDTAAAVVIRKSQVPARVNDLQRQLAASGFQHHISIEQLRNGLRVQISESLLLASHNKGICATPGDGPKSGVQHRRAGGGRRSCSTVHLGPPACFGLLVPSLVAPRQDSNLPMPASRGVAPMISGHALRPSVRLLCRAARERRRPHRDHPSSHQEVSTLFSVDVTILGKRLELEAYPCGALYVRLGGAKGWDWFTGEGRATSSELFLPSIPANSKHRSRGPSRMAGSLLATSPSSPPLTPVQDLPHFETQLLGGKRLLDEVHSLIQYTVVGDNIGRVPRHEQAFEAWAERE